MINSKNYAFSLLGNSFLIYTNTRRKEGIGHHLIVSCNLINDLKEDRAIGVLSHETIEILLDLIVEPEIFLDIHKIIGGSTEFYSKELTSEQYENNTDGLPNLPI